MLELFVEDEHTMQRRRSLQATQRRLTAAIDLITTVAPEVVARPKPAKVQPMKGQEVEEMASYAPPAAAAQVGQVKDISSFSQCPSTEK
jgi:hypothetical protein